MRSFFLIFFLFNFSFLGPLMAEDDFFVVEGDIAVKKGPLKSSFLRSADRWPGGVIPWTIDQNDANNDYLLSGIKEAMNILNEHTNLVFKKRTAKDKNYLVFTTKNDGCFSYVGMQGGPQQVNLSNGCHQKYIVAHEILHAVGMEHEQSRDDRDNYIDIIWENIQDSQKSNFGMVRRSNYGTYNLNSIMQYGSYAFSKNGRPTMVKKDGTVFEQNLKFLTKGDQDAVNNFYPFKFNFDLDQVGLDITQDGNFSNIRLNATAELIKSIQSVVYRINDREISNELNSWENKFSYVIQTKMGKNIILTTFNLKDNTQVQKEFKFYNTGRKLLVSCQFQAKNRQIDFEVPITYDDEEVGIEGREIKDYFAKVSAIFNTSRNTMVLKLAAGRKAGIIRHEEMIEKSFTNLENNSYKIEFKDTELSCEVTNESL